MIRTPRARSIWGYAPRRSPTCSGIVIRNRSLLMSESPRRRATSLCRCRRDGGNHPPGTGVSALQAGEIPYWRAEFVLDQFVRCVRQHWGDHGEAMLDDAITRWCARVAARKAVTVANEFGVVRQLCLYRRRRDPSSYVPEHALAPVKALVFLPYIFSHDEVLRILTAAGSHVGRFTGASMLRTLILVLYCTGLRLGEAVRLRTSDVDLEHGTFMIQRSKGRSRIVAIRPDLVAELRSYTAERQRLLRKRRRADPVTFFLRLDASPLTLPSASNAIRQLLRQLGIKPVGGRVGARPYEFRHAFAVHRLTAWANDGVDVHAKLPSLSTYLGNQNIVGTEVYLRATPQLLELASACAMRARQREQSSPARAVRTRRSVLLGVPAASAWGDPAHRARHRDALKLLFEFRARRSARQIASLEHGDLDADTIVEFLNHIEATRSNSVATRNCRRAALRSFFKHLVRNDLAHSPHIRGCWRSLRRRLRSDLPPISRPTLRAAAICGRP